MIYIFLLPIIFMSVVFHEVAHGLTAYLLGDDTAKRQGRLSFNPIHHIDKFGTIMLPILLLIVSKGQFSFGYAKPVPINPYNFKDYKIGSAITAIAGPATNFVIALCFALLVRFLISTNPMFLNSNEMFSQVLFLSIYLNLFLMFLNLIPFPPLDGSKVIGAFLSDEAYFRYTAKEKLGMQILMGTILISYIFKFSIISLIIEKPVRWAFTLLTGINI